MRTQLVRNQLLSVAGIALTALTLAVSLNTRSVLAQAFTTDPNLPVIYPDGVYHTADQFFATYLGPGLVITLNNVNIKPVNDVIRIASGPNETESFTVGMDGLVSVNGSPFTAASGNGPATWETFGKIGNVTGTFATEWLSMTISGTSPFGPFMIRESPTLASTGQTTISALGGGQFKIDSFFDVFTELSIDGGASWLPANSSAHVILTELPEPSAYALCGLAVGLLGLSRARRSRRATSH